MPKITKRLMDDLMPDKDRDVQIMDSELRGFGVRVKPSGSAAYFVRYRMEDGSARRLVLGKVGGLTPDEARKLAKAKLADVAKGADPSRDRKSKREGLTIAEICDWYLEAAAKGDILGRRGERIKASTLSMDKSRIETHVKPLIGRDKADSLTDTDIARLQRDIAAGKTAKAREGRGGVTTGGAGVAARTVRMVGAILEHAKKDKLVKINAVRGVRQLAEGKSDRRLSEDEITALGEAIRSAAAKGEGEIALTAIKFLLLTGLRRNEALSLRWDEVDAKEHCLRFAKDRKDTMETVKSGLVRPIGASALAVLEAARPLSVGGWVFPATRGQGHFIGLPKVLDRLLVAADIKGATVHTLRHTFSSVAGDEGFSEMTVAALLGHARRGVTQRYVKVDRAAVLAADAVAAKISALLDGQPKIADVIDMNERRQQA